MSLTGRLPRIPYLRAMLIATAALVALVACAVVCGYTQWPSGRAEKAVTRALRRAGAESVAMVRASVTPFRGLVVDSLTAVLPQGGGRALRVSVGRAQLSWRPFGMLRNRGRVRRATGTLGQAGTAWWAGLLTLADSGCVATAIRSFSANAVACSLQRDTAAVLAMVGGSLYAEPQRSPARCVLSVTFDTLRVGGVPVTVPRLSASLHQGVLDIDTLSGAVLSGTLCGRGRLDLSRGRIDTLTLAVTGARFAARLDDTRSGSVRLEEGTNLELSLSPGPLDRDSLRGWGRVTAGRLSAEEFPVLTMLAKLLRAQALRRSAFDSLSASVLLRPGGVQVQRLAGHGPALSFTSSGWVGFDGGIRQQAQGQLSTGVVRGLDPVVRHSLLPGPGGSGRFACVVKGTLSQPVVTLDQRMVERAVEGLFELYRDEMVR